MDLFAVSAFSDPACGATLSANWRNGVGEKELTMKNMICLIAALAISGCVVPANQPAPAPAPRPVAQPTPPPAHPTPPPRQDPPPPPPRQDPVPPPIQDPPPPPARPAWDATGWTLLGEKWVNGRRDRDVIPVGVRTGAFTKLTIVVTDSSLVMDNVTVVFGNNTKFSPRVRHTFNENTRTRPIDLPGNTRRIKRVNFRYGNLPGGGRAKVQVWAKGKAVGTQPPPPTYQPPKWNTTGWTNLGHRWVRGRRDNDAISLAGKGAFTHLTFDVAEGNLEMFDVVVVFGNGEKFSPNLRHTFRNGSRSRAVNLPGHRRNIRRVIFKYGNFSARKSAKVTVWGIDRAPKPQPPKWSANGWSKIGEKWVRGRRDKDIIRGRGKGAFTHITVVVTESDLRMFDMIVTFGNGEKFSPNLKHIFKNGSRSQVINLPGYQRNIKNVAFKYGNLPGRGRAKVAVYGKNNGAKPAPPKWQPRGWTKISEKWVNGRRDRDIISVRGKGAFTHLTVVVSDSDLRMFDMEVKFGNNEKFNPNLQHIFKNGARSRSINLPGHQRNIKTIAFKYGNLPGTGRAKVAVYGKNSAPKPKPPKWQPTGWVKLGEKWVNGRRDRDVIGVGRKKGAFSAMMIVVKESDLRMEDVVVTFGNRQKFSPKLKHIFNNGARSRKIDLPGNVRNINKVAFRYGNLPGSGRAKVELWAKAGPQAPGDKPSGWNSRGWSKIGSRVVQGKTDVDSIGVGKYAKKWKTLTLRVEGGDVYVSDVKVVFGNGQVWSPNVRHLFKDGGRSRAIRLPKARKIKTITMSYGKAKRKGRPVVTLWAK